MSERVRTTISVDSEVLQVFKGLADMGNISVGRFIGDWLADTADGAQHVAVELERAREASRGAIRDIHAKLGVGDVARMVSQASPAAEPAPRPPAAGARTDAAPAQGSGVAPSSNTGLKSPGPGKKSSGKA